jgi:hypothetical protein
VVRDEQELGFDEVASAVGNALTLYRPPSQPEFELSFVSNPLVPDQGDDFDTIVLQSGDVLDSLDAENEPRKPMENLRAAVQDASRVLAALHRRIDGTGLMSGLEDALDRWDAWAEQFTDPDYIEPGFEEGTS